MFRRSGIGRSASNAPDVASGERGFALVTVVALAALLAFILAGLAANMRAHVRAAADSGRALRAEAAADGAIALAMARLLDAAERPGVVAGTTASCRLPEGDVASYSISDEAGRIDLNFATPQLLEVLLLGTGVGLDRARAVRDAILDYRDRDDDRRPDGAERAAYAAAGRSAGPSNAPFIVVDELASVLGIDGPLFVALAPHVTVDSAQEGLDPKHVSPILLDIIRRGLDRGAGGLSLGLGEMGFADLPRELTIASASRAFAIRGLAREPAGAVFVRDAVVVVSTDVRRRTSDAQGALPSLSSRSTDAGVVRARLRTTRWRQGMISSSEAAALQTGLAVVPLC